MTICCTVLGILSSLKSQAVLYIEDIPLPENDSFCSIFKRARFNRIPISSRCIYIISHLTPRIVHFLIGVVMYVSRVCKASLAFTNEVIIASWRLSKAAHGPDLVPQPRLRKTIEFGTPLRLSDTLLSG